MVARAIGVAIDGATGRLGTTQHLRALLALREFFIEARVFDRACDLRREQCEKPRMVFSEIAYFFAFEVHDTDRAVLQNERHGDFRANVRLRCDVARISQRIHHAHDLARFGGRAG